MAPLVYYEYTHAAAMPCTLLAQRSASVRCVPNETYGCGENTVWVRGCRGDFQCGARRVRCGDPFWKPAQPDLICSCPSGTRTARPLAILTGTRRAGCLRGQGPGSWKPVAGSAPIRPHWHVANDMKLSDPAAIPPPCFASPPARSDSPLAFDFKRCHLERLDLSRVCSLLAGREVVFVGDSMQMHFYTSFAMLLSPNRNDTRHLLRSRFVAPTTVCDGHVILRAAREDWLTLPWRPDHVASSTGLPSLSETNGHWLSTLQADSVVVLAVGAHYFPPEKLMPHLQQVAAALRRAAKELRVRLVLRSMVSGHPNCSGRGALSDLPARHRDYLAQRLHAAGASFWERYKWRELDSMREDVDSIFANADADTALLDAHAPAAERPDLRVGAFLRPGYAHPAQLDCLHFCVGDPEGVYDTWALTLVNMIQEWGVLV